MQQTNYYDLATALVNAGISVLPIKPANGDDDKRPGIDSWKILQSRVPTAQELASWFKGYSCRGIAAIGGPVSGGLECIDFDEPGLFDEWASEVDKVAPDLLDRCVIVKTPKVGMHVWYRCSVVQPSQLLAARPPKEEELAVAPKKKFVKRIETRGTGGYALLPGSAAECHSYCLPYIYYALRGLGDLCRVQEIAVGERDVLFRLARSYSLIASTAPIGEHRPLSPNGSGGLSIGDDYEAKASWQEILEPHGWHVDSGTWENGRLCRPGKRNGCSATVGWCKGKLGEPLLCVFSTDAGFPIGPDGRSCFGKFRAYAELNHGGDHKAAAMQLGHRGYGMQKATPTRGASANGQANRIPANEPPQQQPASGSLKVGTFRNRKVQPVTYLVKGKIPLGKVTMIAGVGGMGKSTLTRHLIACLTTGRPALGLNYDAPPPCDVLLASVEDSPEDTIIPHLIAEGADLGRVIPIEGVQRNDERGVQDYLFDLRDVGLVVEYVRANPQAKLLIIDPILSFVGRAGINENRSAEVRTLLDPLIKLAQDTGLAILLIAHLNKATSTSAVNRVIGSTAFRDACRVVYAVGHDPDDHKRRVLAIVKENVPGISQESVAFGRVPLSPERLAEVLAAEQFSDLDAEGLAIMEGQLAVVQPLGASDHNADGILGDKGQGFGGGSSKSEPSESSKIKRCAEWLKGRLGTTYSWVDAAIEEEAMKLFDISNRTFREAKKWVPGLNFKATGYGANKVNRIGIGVVDSMPIAEQHEHDDIPQ